MTPEEMKTIEEIKGLVTDLRTRSEKAGETLTASQKSAEEKLNARISDLEAKLNRPAAPSMSDAQAESTLAKKAAFNSFLRKGLNGLNDVERKAMSVGDNTTGGYLVLPEFAQEVVKNLTEISPVRQLARVASVMSSTLSVPTRTGLVSGTWTAEAGASTASNSTYGQRTIAVHKASVEVVVSRELLNDSAFDVEAEIAADAAEQFAQLEGAAYVSGNGISKPEGFLTNAALASGGVPVVTSATNDTFAADDTISLLYKPKMVYGNQGTFACNRLIMAAIRKFKDATSGAYLWQSPLSAGSPATLLGRPIVEFPDMTGTVADAAYVLAFGDWRAGYWIADGPQMEVVRDDFTNASNGQVRFIFFKRVGGAVVKPEALSVLKIQ